jgi:hypothetical protein
MPYLFGYSQQTRRIFSKAKYHFLSRFSNKRKMELSANPDFFCILSDFYALLIKNKTPKKKVKKEYRVQLFEHI